jgi:hypothetical protein
MGSGSHAAWINSDDMLCKDALLTHVTRYELADDLVHVGDCINIDGTGRVLFRHRGRVHCLEDLLRIRSVWSRGGYICQQEVLFPLQLALQVGGLSETNHYSMDYELWGRFFIAGARVQYTGIPFGMFRLHEAQKTQRIVQQMESTIEAAEALVGAADSLSMATKQEILSDLRAYRNEYPDIAWKHTGRLARMGLPPSLVTPIRHLRKALASTVSDLKRSAR